MKKLKEIATVTLGILFLIGFGVLVILQTEMKFELMNATINYLNTH